MSNATITNTSDQNWTLAQDQNSSSHGNIYFSNGGSGTAENGPWVLPPNTTCDIQYTSTAGKISGNWAITDHLGQTQLLSYSNDFPIFSDPRIAPCSDPGVVMTDYPQNGGMQIQGADWK